MPGNAPVLPGFDGCPIPVYPPVIQVSAQGFCVCAGLEHSQQCFCLLCPIGQPRCAQIRDVLQGILILLSLDVIQFSRPPIDPVRDPFLAGRLSVLRIRVVVTFDGVLLSLCRVLGEVFDLVSIKFRKQWDHEVDSEARMSLVEEQGAIDQTCCTNRRVRFPGDTRGQVQVGDNKGQFLFTVVAQRGLQ